MKRNIRGKRIMFRMAMAAISFSSYRTYSAHWGKEKAPCGASLYLFFFSISCGRFKNQPKINVAKAINSS